MSDVRTLLLALLIATPFACSHPNRDPNNPPGPTHSAGNDTGPPAPTGTTEPLVPGVPNASTGPASLRANPAANSSPAAFDDSRTTIKPSGIGQASGGSVGTGGTLGTGGSSATGGTLGSGGTGGGVGGTVSTGGSIVH